MINFWLEIGRILKLGPLSGEAVKRLRRLEKLGYKTDFLFRWSII